MFVVFEGIDGSGKTTVSNRVAGRLRAGGLPVEHVRENGEFSSPLVRRLRDFGRDARNLAMEPWAELLFYLAREAQIQAELTRPALARGGLVFADRFVDSYEVLAHDARGLPRDRVRAAIDAMTGGLRPDLVVLLDVDPHVARARRRVGKIHSRAEGRDPGGGSRKGLAGVGQQWRMREGYLELARRNPGGWLVIDNGAVDVELDDVVEQVSDAIRARLRGGAPANPAAPPGEAASGVRPGGAPASPAATPANPARPGGVDARARRSSVGLDQAPARFYGAIEARARREPGVAAYFLAGLADPAAWAWRGRLADPVPHAVAYGLRGLSGDSAWALRRELADRAPFAVARSLAGAAVHGAAAEEMRRALFEVCPEAVVATIDGLDDLAAWELRERLIERDAGAVLASLARVDTPRAWAVRSLYVDQRGGEAGLKEPAAASAVARSLRGLGGEEAWRLRQLCFPAAPVAALESLAGLTDDVSWAWRGQWVERAPRAVMATLFASDDARAWDMRRQVAPRVKEILDSMVGMGGEEAWALRDAWVDRWPSTSVKSLGTLYSSARGRDLAARVLADHPADVSLLKHLTALSHDAEGVEQGAWEDAG